MSLFNRPQRLAWESSVERAKAALEDPNQRATRLGVRLQSATTSLQECLTALVRASEAVEKAQQAAARSNARLADLINLLPISYLVTTRDGIVLGANDAAASALNLSARALIGRDLLLFFDDRDRWKRFLAAMEGSETAVRVANLKPRERGGTSVSATLSVLAGSDGETIQWLLTSSPNQGSIVSPPLAATG